jgi:hypothetical protein
VLSLSSVTVSTRSNSIYPMVACYSFLSSKSFVLLYISRSDSMPEILLLP